MFEFPDIESIHPTVGNMFPEIINDLHRQQVTDFRKTKINVIHDVLPIDWREVLLRFNTNYFMDFMVYLPDNNDFCHWRFMVCCRWAGGDKNFIWLFDNDHGIPGLLKIESEIAKGRLVIDKV